MAAPKSDRIIVHEADLVDPRQSGGKWIRAVCHIHGGDHQRSLSINATNGFGRCQNCGAEIFVPELNPEGAMRAPKPITAERLLRPVAPKAPTEIAPAPWQIDELEALTRLADRCRAHLDDVRPRAYLDRRGIPYEVALSAGVGYVPDMTLSGPLSKWRDRLVFALGSPAGLGYAGRSLWGWAPGMDEDEHKAILDADGAPKRWRKTNPAGYFGYDQLGDAEIAVIVEGPVDALALLASGLFPETPVLALVGTACRAEQAPASLRHVVVALDGDEVGATRSADLARELPIEGLVVATAIPPDDGGGKDWSARWRISRHAGLWPISEALDRLAPDAAPDEFPAREDPPLDPQLDPVVAAPEISTEISTSNGIAEQIDAMWDRVYGAQEVPPGFHRFHSIPCSSSPDGWAEFSGLRATPRGPLLCIHCGKAHGAGA
jgi:hypothetical protein